MAKTSLATAAIGLLFIPTASAQTPPSERLDALLKAMERRMLTIDSFQATCTRTDIHPLTKKASVASGQIAWQRPNLARIDLCPPEDAGKKDQDKAGLERFIADGKYIWEYSVPNKLIVAHELPKDAMADNVLLMLTRGMTAVELKKRFDVKLASDKEPFATLRLLPRSDADRQDFAALDLSVWTQNMNPQGKAELTYLPAQLRWFHPNGREVKYQFGELQPNARMEDTTFKAYRIPGFEVKFATMSTAPESKRQSVPSRKP